MENTKEFLIKEGYLSTSLPWRMEGKGIAIILCQLHSSCKYDFSIISIANDDTIFRGNIPDEATFHLIIKLIEPAI